MPGAQQADMERQGIAQVRYQIAGQREVVVLSFDSMYDYQATISLEVTQGQNFFGHMEELLETLSTDESMQAFHKHGAVMWHGILEPGSFFYVPMGHWVVERTLNTTCVCGMRTAVLESSPQAFSGWKRLREAHESMAGSDTALGKFWTTVNQFMA